MRRVLIIAEAGVNHSGSCQAAAELVEAAARVGADVVKFQTFTAEKVVTSRGSKARYQEGSSDGSTQLEMLRTLELPRACHAMLSELAQSMGIEFLSTPFDIGSLRFLVDEIGVRRLKVSSGDITNLPLLHAAGETGLPVILSTGGSTLVEARMAVGTVVRGRLAASGTEVCQLTQAQLFEFASSDDCRSEASRFLTVLQCTSEYPAPANETNLRAITTLREELAVATGLSDHSLGGHLAVAATALGASVIEKHLTLDRDAAGPDHRASLDPGAFAEMVEGIRSVETALGDGHKTPSPAEAANIPLIRRGLYAARDLRPGDVLQETDIDVLRPANAVAPAEYWSLLGRTVERPLMAGQDLIL